MNFKERTGTIMPSGHVAKVLNDKVIAEGYPEARRNLSTIFNSFIFVSVQSVEIDSVKDYFRGEAQEMGERFPRLVFFEKYSRVKSSTQFLSMTIVDSLSTPQVGDILWGSLAPAKSENARCKFQLKGWSCSKQLSELRRMVKFGCNKTENFTRNVLLQTSSEIAKMKLFQFPNDLKLRAMSVCRDDIWMAAKVILWGNTRHLAILDNKNLKEPLTDNEKVLKEGLHLSKTGQEIAEILAEKLGCIQILQDYWSHIEQVALPPLPPAPVYVPYGQAMPYAYAPPPAAYSGGYAQDPEHQPHSPYMPSSPIEGGKTPEYVPQSPVDNEYVATSPI